MFEPDVAALVRETLQNSNDQLAPGSRRVIVTLRTECLEGQHLEHVRKAFDLDTLTRHLAAVRVAKARFETGLGMIHGESLPGLWIEDRGTTGLVGDETGSGNFAALCRDRLFSEKQRAEAGGSFGLGKAVLWRFSNMSTVAFYSRLANGPRTGQERFIIKASLPFHETATGAQCSGDGWFGHVEKSGRGVRAVSLWNEDARLAAKRLGARLFEPEETGTSIFIAGFDDPAADEPGSLETIEDRLRIEASRSFWPALERKRLTVSVGNSQIRLDDSGVERRLAAMLRAYDRRAEVASLTNTEQIAVERVTVQLPASRSGEHGQVQTVADVIVQVADENEEDLGLMWCFRGPGMIIERRDLQQISLAARPFRAILVCGEAVRDDPPNQTALEVFLKTAEPPAHDRWIPTPRLKERYKQGWKVGLQRLMTAAKVAVRKHVAIPTETTESGPQKLRRLFKVGTVGGGRSESEFHFRDLRAEIVGDAWQFHAKVLPNLPTESAWSTVVDVEFPEERGRDRTSGTIANVEVDGADHALIDGQVHLVAPPGTEFVEIRGATDPQKHPVAVREAAIDLVIRSHVEESS